jgi:hypothetical protein
MDGVFGLDGQELVLQSNVRLHGKAPLGSLVIPRTIASDITDTNYTDVVPLLARRIRPLLRFGRRLRPRRR